MIVLLYLTGFLLFSHGVYQLAKYFIIIAETKIIPSYNGKDNYSEKTHKITILVPVLHEEENIKKFLYDILHQNYPKDSYEVYVITTEREYLSNTRPNTIDVLRDLMSRTQSSDPRVTQIHYPYTNGFKAHQLNFALNELRKKLGGTSISSFLFLLLDADSEVDENTLRRFSNSIEGGVGIYQQPLLWFKNIDVLRSSLMLSFSFLQSFFSISYEIPMFTSRFLPWRLKYLVGHGLLVRGSFLDRIGGFPDTIEDVRLGRLSSFLDEKVKVVPGFGMVETAKDFFTQIKQFSVWFFGCGLFLRDYTHARALKRVRRISAQDCVFVIYGFFKAFRWLNKGLLHLVGFIISIYYSSLPILLLFLSSLLVNSVIPTMLVSKDFKNVLKKKLGGKTTEVSLRAILLSPVFYMLNFVGPYYGLFKLVKLYLWGNITLPKTER